MKQTVIILAITAMMVSCKSKSKDDTKVLSASEVRDSIEFVKFKETKAKNEAAAAARAANPATVNNTPAAPATAHRKKGWSKAAKGAVIGGTAGAVTGAILDKKNRAAGAVIGGVLGAGAGYGVGRAKDKKDGRN